jgi:hypothetical protein
MSPASVQLLTCICFLFIAQNWTNAVELLTYICSLFMQRIEFAVQLLTSVCLFIAHNWSNVHVSNLSVLELCVVWFHSSMGAFVECKLSFLQLQQVNLFSLIKHKHSVGLEVFYQNSTTLLHVKLWPLSSVPAMWYFILISSHRFQSCRI